MTFQVYEMSKARNRFAYRRTMHCCKCTPFTHMHTNYVLCYHKTPEEFGQKLLLELF
jgi:hypothetical protein